uniref:Bola bacterial stress-induced morphogen-related protein n=1 Tax=Syphacia muris TaxID=451379 RepID=A0A0N5AV08_9BILA
LVQLQRGFSATKHLTDGEAHIIKVLEKRFPKATSIKVTDISGGCGSMYQVTVESAEFAGKSRVLQHKSVTDALKAEMPSMHGIVIETLLPANKKQ